MSVTIKLDTTKLDQMLAQIPKRKDLAVERAAQSVAAEAKINIRNWPLVDTGALLNSITAERIKTGLWEVGDFGGYTKKRGSRFGWHDVSAGMEYAVYWELGHHNLFTRRYMRMPFLQPALYKVAREFEKIVAEGILIK